MRPRSEPRAGFMTCPNCGGKGSSRHSTCCACDSNGQVVARWPFGDPPGGDCPSYAPAAHAGALDAPSARSCGGCARRPACPSWVEEDADDRS